jgi:High-affinity nickel-transport protein
VADQRARLTRIRQGLTPAEWARFGGMVVTVVGLNVLGWGMLAAALGGHYHIGKTTVFGVGTGALAYTLGMRHAFDADHIAAIDNRGRPAGPGRHRRGRRLALRPPRAEMGITPPAARRNPRITQPPIGWMRQPTG